jgi:glutaminase
MSRPDAASARLLRPKDDRERSLFRALQDGDSPVISARALPAALAEAGLEEEDPRLADSMRLLRSVPDSQINYETFTSITRPNILLIEKALSGNLVIPRFSWFREEMRSLYESSRGNRDGKVADYIPQLGRVDPERFAVSLCTVDGQRFSQGDSKVDFSIQSACKPINYCLALEDSGAEKVHQHIGCEPSGLLFNELTVNGSGLPHNPMINAGAIMSGSLIRPDLSAADRFDHVLERWTGLTGGIRPRFSNSTYLSERRSADRNFALGYLLRENGAFPDGTDLLDTLEFYFQCCSLELNSEDFSLVAATLANGGICPLSGVRVLEPGTVQKCLSLMYSCGMYNYSGKWAFTVGIPAKSGVSGVLVVVIPNVMGLAIWSPRLDQNGNSVRGIQFCRELVGRFNLHNYDNLAGVRSKVDPRLETGDEDSQQLVDLCWAASKGDLSALRRMVARGANLDAADYDGRTALHLAASEGHLEVVQFFLDQGVMLNPRDRWGGSPLDDARREGHREVAELLAQGSDGGEEQAA